MTAITLAEVCHRLSCTRGMVEEHIAAGRLTPLIIAGQGRPYFNASQVGGVQSYQTAAARKQGRFAAMDALQPELLMQCRRLSQREVLSWLAQTYGLEVKLKTLAAWEEQCLGPEGYRAEVRRKQKENALRGRRAKKKYQSFTLAAAPLPGPADGHRWPVRGMDQMSRDELQVLEQKLQRWVAQDGA